MAVKLSSLTLSKRIPNWVSLKSHLSSISCAINIQTIPDTDQNQSNCSDFEAKIQFLKNKLHSDSLVSVLDCTPDLNSSLKLFKWASLQNKFHHTADTYHKMIFKLGMAGNVEEMQGFCSEMVREKCQGFEKSLLALIDSFVSNHRFSEALRVLYVMNLSSFKPSIGVFNALMGALVEGKRDFKDVVFVYKEMVKAGVLPNMDTLNYLLEALFESERVDTAMDKYKRMHKKGCNPNSRTYEILVSCLCARNRVNESIIILNDMFQLGFEPEPSFYCCTIPIFCRLQNLEIAKKLFEMMRPSNISPNSVTCGAMISCLCEYLFMDDAVEVYEEMIKSGLLPETQIHLDVINGFCKLKRYDEAKNFLEEKNVLDTCVYNALLGSYCDSGSFRMAKNTFDEMFEKNITDAWSWNIIIRFICENSVINSALQYLCRMVVSSFVPDATTYSAVILGNCRKGEVDGALDLFRQIRSKCWILDSGSYAEFVDSLCQTGKNGEASEVFCYMSSQDCALQSTSFSILIEKICAIGDVKRAIRLLSLSYCTSTISSVSAYNSILRVLFKSGQENYLLVILSQMIVNGCAFDAETYFILIQSMSALNNVGNCVSLFNIMLSKDLMPDRETFGCLLSCLDRNSQMHLILSSIDKLISMPDILDSTMNSMLISSLWREGHRSEASHLLDVMLEKGWVPDVSTHTLVMGSASRKEMSSKKYADEIFAVHDEVNSILAEGLGET